MNVLSLSFFVLLFGTMAGVGQFFQIFGVLLFFISVSLINAKFNRKNIDAIFVFIGILIPLASIFSLLFFGDFSLVFNSLVFMISAFIAKIISISKSTEKIVFSYLKASIFMVVVVLAFHSGGLIDSLSLSSDIETGRYRFSPFDNHPNLTGHIFGTCAIVAFVYLYWNIGRGGIYFYVVAAVFLISFIFVAAASSRGGIVSTISALFGFLFLRWMDGKNIYKIFTRIFYILISFFLLLYIFGDSAEYFDYIGELFELNSEFRGTDSGLTGRSDNWPLIFSRSLSDLQGIFLGHGLRSWDAIEQGIATDSTYINQLWESGVFLSIGLFFLVFKKMILASTGNRNFEKDIVFSILLFIVIESIVARYMLGIGNPASLFILIILLKNFEDK